MSLIYPLKSSKKLIICHSGKAYFGGIISHFFVRNLCIAFSTREERWSAKSQLIWLIFVHFFAFSCFSNHDACNLGFSSYSTGISSIISGKTTSKIYINIIILYSGSKFGLCKISIVGYISHYFICI